MKIIILYRMDCKNLNYLFHTIQLIPEYAFASLEVRQ